MHNRVGPVHGLVASVFRDAKGHDCPLFTGLAQQFAAVRYHSLCVTDLAHCLLPTSWAIDRCEGKDVRVLMSVRHRHKPLFGVQFHPESVCTQFGRKLVSNFLRVARGFKGAEYVPVPMGREVGCGDAGDLKVYVRCIRDVSWEADEIFAGLYGKRDVAFWLDSSTAMKRASVSTCSSPGVDGEEMDVVNTDVYQGRNGRFSIMGGCEGPLAEIVTYDVENKSVEEVEMVSGRRQRFNVSIFDFLERRQRERYIPLCEDLPMEMNGGYVGFLGYELKLDTHGVRRNLHQARMPDAWFIFADRVVIVDHEKDDVYLVAIGRTSNVEDLNASLSWFDTVTQVLDSPPTPEVAEMLGCARGVPASRAPLRFVPERRRSEYMSDIRTCLKEIGDGESYEVCLTNRLRTKLPETYTGSALQLYATLRKVNPAPYSAFLKFGKDQAVCCSSPERFLCLTSEGFVESKPIKGTLPRGRCVEEDDVLREQLRNSPKDRAENLMIVDLVRNDLSRTCRVGSVQVPKLMHVESFATVHQLVSTVIGQLEPSASTIECIQAAYPMGSMTGAPKVRTMEIIERLERSARGIYSGSIGYLSLCGAADMNVVIRTAVLDGRKVEIGVGGAIVALSDVSDEYDEVILKGAALMQAIATQVTGCSDYIVLHEEEGKCETVGLPS